MISSTKQILHARPKAIPIRAINSFPWPSLLLLCLSVIQPLHAIDTLKVTSPDPLLDPARWTVYDRRSGLAGKIYQMYEDRNGNIWFGTDRGAQKYDGLTWTTYTTENGLTHNSVNYMMQARDGAMWFGGGTGSRGGDSTFSAGITRLVEATDTNERQVTTHVFKKWGTTRSILEAADGSIWANLIGHNVEETQNIHRYAHGKWETTNQPQRTSRPMVEDGEGHIWATSQNNEIMRFDPLANAGQGSWTRFGQNNGPPNMDKGFNFFAVDKKGHLWTAYANGVSRYNNDTWEYHSLQTNGSIAHGADGTIWIGGGTNNRLSMYENGKWKHYPQSALPHPIHNPEILMARDGSTLWIADWSGVKVYRVDLRSTVQVYESADTLRVGPEGSDGSMWFHTPSSVIQFKDGIWLENNTNDGFLNGEVRAITRTADGAIWAAGTHNAKGATARYHAGKWQIFTEGIIDQPTSIMPLRDGTLWLMGTHKGKGAVSYFHPKNNVWKTETSIFQGWRVMISYEASDGTLWFGEYLRDDTVNWGTGLYRYDPLSDQWMHFGEADGFVAVDKRWGTLDGLITGLAEWPTGTLRVGTAGGMYHIDLADLPENRRFHQTPGRALGLNNLPKLRHFTPTDDALWFTPLYLRNAGVVRYDRNTYTNFTKKDGLTSDGITSIFRTSDDAIWFRDTSGKFTRFDPQVDNGKWTQLTHGLWQQLKMPGVSTAQSVTESKDGSIWLNSGTGVAQIRYEPEPLPETFIDTAPKSVSSDGDISLIFSGRTLWDAIPFEDLTYSWRLDDGEWTKTENAVLTLTNLTPGAHRFEVRTSTPTLQSDPSPAVHTFVVALPWWHDPLVAGPGLLLVFGFVFQSIRVIRRDRRLRESNAALSDANKKLFQVNVDLERANTEIQQQSEHKSAFLASMSHELRTPMNAIKGFTNLVLRRANDVLPDQQKENLQKVDQASDHLLAMINDLLDLSKIEAGHMDVNPTTFRIEHLIASCVSTVSPLVKDSVSLTYECDTVDEAHTDEARVRQMVINLLSNAIKFTDTGEIKVTATQSNDQLEISVNDTGKGIPAEELPTIFDEYRQVKGSESSVQKGTGLGLSITKKFAELLGGTIRVESEEREGSTFTVRIPSNYSS